MGRNGATQKMIKAIIFDCFGVLAEDGWTPFKHRHIAYDSDMERAVADIGRQSDIGAISAAKTTLKMSQIMGVGEDTLKNALSSKVPNEELLAIIDNELKPKFKIGLMSNANYDVVGELFTPEQADLFDATVLSFDTRLAKPDKKMYEMMASRLRVQMDECLFIDDQEKYCVVAKELGMEAIWYKSIGQFKTELNKYC